jgi:hypothetical protein
MCIPPLRLIEHAYDLPHAVVIRCWYVNALIPLLDYSLIVLQLMYIMHGIHIIATDDQHLLRRELYS